MKLFLSQSRLLALLVNRYREGKHVRILVNRESDSHEAPQGEMPPEPVQPRTEDREEAAKKMTKIFFLFLFVALLL